MEHDGQTGLAEGVHLLGFTEQLRSCWNEQVLAVVGINFGGEQTLDRAGKAPIETVNEHGFKDGSFKQDVGFSCRRVGRTRLHGGRIFDFLLSVMCCFRGIVADWRERNRIGLHLFQELRDLQGLGTRRGRSRGGNRSFGCRGRRVRRSFPVTQRDV